MPTNGGAPPGPRRLPPRVTLYTTRTCHWCKVAKTYLREHEIPFREIDVMAERRGYKEMVAMTGQSGVPVIRVGEKAIVGWDKREFERLYRRENRRS